MRILKNITYGPSTVHCSRRVAGSAGRGLRGRVVQVFCVHLVLRLMIFYMTRKSDMNTTQNYRVMVYAK
jgi:hypothetical protein